MPYLNLDLDYFDHPKTMRLVGLLGKGTAELPLRLWCKVGKHHAQDGRLAGYSAQEIESLVGWWGQPGKCVEAMVKVGFVEPCGEGYAIHNWTDHQGHIYAMQSKAKTAAKARWDKLRASKEQCSEQCLGNAPNKAWEGSSSKAGKAVVAVVSSKASSYGLGMPHSPEFLAFWDAYPRKNNQKAASEAWNALAPPKEAVIEIMGGLAQYKTYWTNKKTAFEHIPFASHWLRDERWKDDLSAPDLEGDEAKRKTEAYFREIDGR